MRQERILRFVISPVIALFALLLSSCAGSAATAKDTYNKYWTLCLTEIDTASLPIARQAIGSLVMQRLAESLKTVDIRVRLPEESAWYRDLVWGKNRQAAAAAITAKQQERDKLIFQGYSSSRLSTERKKIDSEIASLHEKYRIAYKESPEIMPLPAFTLTDANKAGTYPPPPVSGEEYFFCTASVNSDAFLACKISEYHERIYFTLKLYTLYTKSFSYTDTVVFSSEDVDNAVNEIIARLVDELSRRKPAAIQVSTNTEDAMIVIDNKLAGRGETEVFETNPGVKTVSVFNDNYRNITVPVELLENETASVSIEMQELPAVNFTIETAGTPATTGGAAVYRGALYVGETPLKIASNEGREEHITVEDKNGNFGVNIFKANNAIIDVKLNQKAEEGLVEKRRKQYYASNTRFWLSLPVAVFLSGVAASYASNYNKSTNPDAFYNKAVTMQIVSYASIGVTVGFFAESLVRSGFYMAAASKPQNPVAIHEKPKHEEKSADKKTQQGEKTSIFKKSTNWIKGLFTKKKSDKAEERGAASVEETEETAETGEAAEENVEKGEKEEAAEEAE